MKNIKLHQLKGLWVCAGMMIFGGGLLSRVHAEGNARRGSISLTFHEEDSGRPVPKSFFVVREKGKEHWRNYKERETPVGGKGQFVYEVKNPDRVRVRQSSSPEPQTARVETPPSVEP